MATEYKYSAFTNLLTVVGNRIATYTFIIYNMKQPKSAILFTFLVSLFACKTPPSKPQNATISELGHIDVILDSTTWYAIKTDSFVRSEFGVLEIDTTYYGGKPSYDLYVLGSLNFLHFSLAKGYWDNQQGGGVLVFQSQKPGQKDSLLHSWKQFYADSLYVHTFKGGDFTLDEVMAWYKRDTTKPKEARIFANLTTYSVDAYRNWGITDSLVNAGLVMKQFMEDWGGEELKNRLFNSITELQMAINPQEFKEIRTALLTTGYEENNDHFTHAFNPPIYITTSEKKGKSKYTKVKFKLNRSIPEKEIVFSPKATLKLSGTEAWFLFN